MKFISRSELVFQQQFLAVTDVLNCRLQFLITWDARYLSYCGGVIGRGNSIQHSTVTNH